VTRKLRAAAVDAGAPLAAWLAARLGLDPDEARRRVELGAVFVDGRRVRDPMLPLGAGARVAVHEPVSRPAPWREVFQDGDVLVVDKPAGLAVTAPRAGGAALDAEVRARFPSARPMHRIDAATSGLVLFTLGPQAQRRLAHDLAAGRVERIYLAIVEGVPPARTLDAAIGPDPADRLRFRAGVPGGRPAATEIRVVTPGARSLVEARLVTGLTHQIRVHLAGAGFPILGDPIYGGGPAPRLALHAHRLAWPGGAARSELPEELARLLS
jgi:23S rRNA pseudouridine1911/1915/1917 synthase